MGRPSADQGPGSSNLSRPAPIVRNQEMLVGADGIWSPLRAQMHGLGNIQGGFRPPSLHCPPSAHPWPSSLYCSPLPTCPPILTIPTLPLTDASHPAPHPLPGATLEDRLKGAKYSGYTCYEACCTYTPEEGKLVAYKIYIGYKKYFVVCDVGNGMVEW